jgi:competence protein ComEA
VREKGSEAAHRLQVLGGARSAHGRLLLPAAPLAGGWVPGEEGAGPWPTPPAPSADPAHWPGTATGPLPACEPAGDPGGDGAAGAAVPRRTVPPAAAVGAAVLALVVAVAVWVHGSSSSGAVELPPRQASGPPTPAGAATGLGARGPAPTTEGPPPSPASGAGATSTEVVVDVEGRVRRPGLQRLTAGSRVADAVRAAGGTTAGALVAGLNLARVLADGEQILVPGPGDPTSAPGGTAAGSAGGPPGPAAPVDLNNATEEGLDALPGVGPVLAGRIVAWRTQHGRFSSVDELAEVPGIGPKALERLRPLVRV